MKKIAITGANGYLASLIQLYNGNDYEFIRVSTKDLDLSHPDLVYAYFDALDMDAVVHTAAIAATATCQNEPERTHRVNAQSAIEIAKVCRDKQKKLIFISTEQVYNGKSETGPFVEEDGPLTVTNYGLHKLEAEAWITKHVENYVILRLSSQIGLALPDVHPSVNLIKQTLSAIRNQTPTYFTVNEKRGITYAQRFASQFSKLLALPSDIYHFSSYNDRNTYEVAQYIAKRFGYDEKTIQTYILPDRERYADRFRDYRLDSSKIKAFGIELGTLEEDVSMCLKDFEW